MAVVGVTHSKVVTIPDDPNYPVGSDEWNAQHVITGLENVDNTSDANKPVSTATQAALDAKVTGPAGATDDLPAIFDGTTGKLIKSKTYAAFKTLLALVKGDVGLGNVPNVDATNASNLSSGTVPAARLPNPTAATLGGVQSAAAVAHNWINSISTAGVPALSQPAAADLSNGVTGTGAVVLAASPAFTGTVTIGSGFSADAAGNVAATGFNLGSSGTGTTSFVFQFLGSSGAAGGARLIWYKNLVALWQEGFVSAILGGTSDDFIWENAATGATAFRINATDTSVSMGSTVASTSTTTGALTVAGGMGVAGDAFHGGKVVSTSPTAGVGYATGAGGTVTQATSKATGVTLNKASGAITMNAAALAAGTIVSFVLTDSAIAATDVLILNHISGGTPGSYSLNARCAAGSATIDVRNNTAGSLSEAIVIQFALIKGVNA